MLEIGEAPLRRVAADTLEMLVEESSYLNANAEDEAPTFDPTGEANQGRRSMYLGAWEIIKSMCGFFDCSGFISTILSFLDLRRMSSWMCSWDWWFL